MTTDSCASTIPAKPHRAFRLWIPFLLVWVLLLPFVILLTPVLFVACLFLRIDPIQAVLACLEVFIALRGIRVEVEDPSGPVRIRIV